MRDLHLCPFLPYRQEGLGACSSPKRLQPLPRDTYARNEANIDPGNTKPTLRLDSGLGREDAISSADVSCSR